MADMLHTSGNMKALNGDQIYGLYTLPKRLLSLLTDIMDMTIEKTRVVAVSKVHEIYNYASFSFIVVLKLFCSMFLVFNAQLSVNQRPC